VARRIGLARAPAGSCLGQPL